MITPVTGLPSAPETLSRDTDRVRTAFLAMRLRRRWRFAEVALPVAVILGLFAWQGRLLFVGATAALGGTAVILFLAISTKARRLRRLRAQRAATDDAEMMAWFREELDREIAELRPSRDGLTRWFPLALGLVGIVVFLIAVAKYGIRPDLWEEQRQTQAQSALVFAIIFFRALRTWVRARTDLPRLEWERAVLDAPASTASSR